MKLILVQYYSTTIVHFRKHQRELSIIMFSYNVHFQFIQIIVPWRGVIAFVRRWGGAVGFDGGGGIAAFDGWRTHRCVWRWRRHHCLWWEEDALLPSTMEDALLFRWVKSPELWTRGRCRCYFLFQGGTLRLAKGVERKNRISFLWPLTHTWLPHYFFFILFTDYRANMSRPAFSPHRLWTCAGWASADQSIQHSNRSSQIFLWDYDLVRLVHPELLSHALKPTILEGL